MFLTADNQIKWKRMGWGAFVTAMLVVLGMCVVDVPIYVFATRIAGWKLWEILGSVFDAKVWIVVTTIIMAVYGVKRLVKTIQSVCDKRIQFKFIDIFKETWVKTRTSHAFLIFSSIFCASAVVWVLKVLIARLRPVFVMSGIVPEFNRFSWAWHSMPSGHTTVTFAGLIMIGMLAPKYKPLTWTLAIVVGVSRVCVGMHWPSDVILGAFIGMVLADIVKWFMLNKLSKGV